MSLPEDNISMGKNESRRAIPFTLISFIPLYPFGFKNFDI